MAVFSSLRTVVGFNVLVLQEQCPEHEEDVFLEPSLRVPEEQVKTCSGIRNFPHGHCLLKVFRGGARFPLHTRLAYLWACSPWSELGGKKNLHVRITRRESSEIPNHTILRNVPVLCEGHQGRLHRTINILVTFQPTREHTGMRGHLFVPSVINFQSIPRTRSSWGHTQATEAFHM